MQLGIPDESVPVKDVFERFFAAESTPARVRAAEPVGFDAALWRSLVDLDAPFMRLPAEADGGGMSLFDACLMLEQAGRRLAAVPLAEAVVAMRILGALGGDAARQWIDEVRGGNAVLTLALHETRPGKPQVVPGGAVAKGILAFDGVRVFIEVPRTSLPAPSTLGGDAIGVFEPNQGEIVVISSGPDAARIWAEGIEEWKLLTSAALIGLSRESIAMAASYASERIAFGQPIGANQGIAHPLANDIVDVDGAALLLWWSLRAIADGKTDAAATVSLLYWWSARVAGASVAHAIHTFGGYGLCNEYDIQLYHRRAKAWALVLGDPEAELVRGGRRLFLAEAACLPDPGKVEIGFEPDDAEHALATEVRALFARILDPEKHRLHEQNFEAHAWDVHTALGEAGLLFPDWPGKWGGRDADADAARASYDVWNEVGYAGLPRGVTGMAGHLVQKFGTPELQDEVLLRFARGEATSCLGFSEPLCGSDVFAARTRAVRDGDDWVIDGQKMFTSGAELASYVLLLARTDPDVPKHKGLTLFLVPLDRPGIEINPVHTFMDERTNVTFYAGVRIEDRYRLSEVNGGARLMAAVLSIEQGGSYYHYELRDMIDATVAWARDQERDGVPFLQHPSALARLARVYAHACIGEALAARARWARISGQQDLAYGPSSKVFSTQTFIDDSADLLDLTAPCSLLRGKSGLGVVEKGYRHSTATSIYGGTSEVLRSMIAEKRLGLPRSRS